MNGFVAFNVTVGSARREGEECHKYSHLICKGKKVRIARVWARAQVFAE